MKTKQKSDNRKALPKYILMLLIAALFGGLAGFGAVHFAGAHQGDLPHVPAGLPAHVGDGAAHLGNVFRD